jgi:hypothetical protein
VVKKQKAVAVKELKKDERFKKAFELQEERIRMKRVRMEFKMQMKEEIS